MFGGSDDIHQAHKIYHNSVTRDINKLSITGLKGHSRVGMGETLHAGVTLDSGLSARVLRQLADDGADCNVGDSVTLKRIKPVSA